MTAYFVDIDDERAEQFLELCRKHRFEVIGLPSEAITTPAKITPNQLLHAAFTTYRIQKLCKALSTIGVRRTPLTLTAGDIAKYFRFNRMPQDGTYWIVQVECFGSASIGMLTNFLHSLGLKWADER